jgi:GPH family glycoside/pentoside/hexuronide:cation symporter
VPYTALGYELTTDYNERTRVLAWRMYIGLFGSLTVPWFYWLCLKIQYILVKLPTYTRNTSGLHHVFVKIQSFVGTDIAAGAFWLSVGLGGTIIITGILPALICREKAQGLTQPKVHIFLAILHTLKNRPFLILCIAYIIIILGLFSAGTLGLYVNIYYVCGSKELAAKISGISGSVGAITSYLSLFLIARFSVRWGKRNAMIIGLFFAMAGVFSMWWTLTPKWPYLQLISSFILCMGLQGCWLMVSSMVADICDEDELKTGLRREGVYGAVNGLALKGALALTAVAGGVMLKFSGYDPKVAESVGSVPIEIAMKMKALMIGGQTTVLVFAIVIFLFYPITKKRSEETRQILDERHRIANI